MGTLDRESNGDEFSIVSFWSTNYLTNGNATELIE